VQVIGNGGNGILRKEPLMGHCGKKSGKAAGLWMDVRRKARGNRHIQC
jgi:hypothetical protein